MQQRKLFVGSEDIVRLGDSCGGGGQHNSLFETIISLPNLFCAWREFQKDKKNRSDVIEFEANVEESIFRLHKELSDKTYRHGSYEAFWVHDPKLRLIHKASVRDRLLHHAIFRVLYPICDKKWIYDSFSSRKNKGTHAALKRFRDFAWNISQNNTRSIWIMKLDIKKYFDSVDQVVLLGLLDKVFGTNKHLDDLLRNNIFSYSTSRNKGIPLGNLTSQLFANIYLNPFDQYVKRCLRVKYYFRYADDIIIVSNSSEYVSRLLPKISDFLEQRLKLTIHPKKISIRRWDKGIDILGFISYPRMTVMRTSTTKRMMNRLAKQLSDADFDIQLSALYSRMKFER